MAHAREALRAAVVARVTGLPTAGARVYTSLVQARAVSVLPFTAVWISSEGVESTSKGDATDGRTQQREAVVTVTVIADTLAKIEAATEEIEAAMAVPELGLRSLLASTEFEESEDNKLRFGVRLNYTVAYHTKARTPGTTEHSF